MLRGRLRFKENNKSLMTGKYEVRKKMFVNEKKNIKVILNRYVGLSSSTNVNIMNNNHIGDENQDILLKQFSLRLCLKVAELFVFS